MKLLHQVSLFVLTLFFLFITFVTGLYAFGFIPETSLSLIAEYIYKNSEVGLVTLILFLLGIWLLQSLFQLQPGVKAVVKQNEMGEVRISLLAIKSLIEQVVLHQPGVKKVSPRFDIQDESFNIYLNLTVLPDSHIPTLSTEVTMKVKDNLLKMMGLTVDNIKILIEEIESSYKNSNSTLRVR